MHQRGRYINSKISTHRLAFKDKSLESQWAEVWKTHHRQFRRHDLSFVKNSLYCPGQISQPLGWGTGVGLIFLFYKHIRRLLGFPSKILNVYGHNVNLTTRAMQK